MIRAVTFDYWRTLLWEQPGQLEQHRVKALTDTLAHLGHPRPTDVVLDAHRTLFAVAQGSWLENRQYSARHLVDDLARTLGIAPNARVAGALYEAILTAGRRTPLTETDNLRSTLMALRATGLRLGIVCDVGLTPSTVLRERLDRRELLLFFQHCSFSDDVGVYKPHPAIFDDALHGLGVQASETVHVGDMRRTDVRGARAHGIHTVRYAGVFDDEDTTEDAEHVIFDHSELTRIVGSSSK